MAISIDWTSGNCLIVSLIGAVSGKELVDAVLTLSGDARFDDTRSIIYDWSEYALSDSNVELTDIEKVAAISSAMAKTNPNVKIAIVFMNKTIEQRGAFSSIYEILIEDLQWEFASFELLDEALKWVLPK